MPVYNRYLTLQNFYLPLYVDRGLSCRNGNYPPIWKDMINVWNFHLSPVWCDSVAEFWEYCVGTTPLAISERTNLFYNVNPSPYIKSPTGLQKTRFKAYFRNFFPYPDKITPKPIQAENTA